MGLLDSAFYQQQQQGGGLLGPVTYQQSPDEDWVTRLVGSRDPRDPRSSAMGAFAAGLIRGDMAGGLEGANRAFSESDQRNMQRASNAMSLQKSAWEIQQMQAAQARQAAIQQEIARMRGGQAAPTGGAPMPVSGPDNFGVPSMGGQPMFSMAGQGGAPAPMLGGAAAMGASGGLPGAAPMQGGGMQGGANPMQQRHQELMQLADVYLRNGDQKTALELYQRAEAYKPKFSTTPQPMRDPRDGQLKYVVMNEDGVAQVLPFGVKPDVSLQDLGGQVVAIDRNSAPNGATWRKTMTPDAQASNAVARDNYRLSRERFDHERSQTGKPQFHDGAWFTPPNAANPQGTVVQPQMPEGASPKLTETQGKATGYATRMRAASRVLDELEGQAWPSSVNRAGYKPDVPSWLPGGQAVGSAVSAINQAFTPEKAQQLYQAQLNWVTANLRQESGAVFGEPELEREFRKYFPQPGESDAVIKQKAQARREAEEAMLSNAGPGAKLVNQSLERADAETAKRGGGKQGQSGAVPLPSMKAQDLKHGQTYELPNGTRGKWNSLKRGFEVVN